MPKKEVIKGVKSWLPANWDYEADVVVVGYGGAGMVMAVTAHDAGAKVLILEKAPIEGGGSTRTACCYTACPSDANDAANYLYAACAGSTPMEVCRAWAGKACKNAEWYDKMDPESCAQIFLEKCKNQKEEDVANVLFYMSERSHAKVLAEMQKADPGAADKVTDRLKRIKEEKA